MDDYEYYEDNILGLKFYSFDFNQDFILQNSVCLWLNGDALLYYDVHNVRNAISKI